jgi:MYXO-CTERM domain-containing protein
MHLFKARLPASRSVLASAAAAAILLLAQPGAAQTKKTFIDYFRPTPTVCAVSSQTWGVSSVLPRDTCNGLESTKIPPAYYYWDGKILRAPDGKYHLFADRWPNSAGFGGWVTSETIHAVSATSLLGPFADMGYAFDNGPNAQAPHRGHNASACELPDGSYCLYVNEIVPFTMFTAPSLDGPWTNKGHVQIDTNGVPVNFPPPGDRNMESNVSLVVRPDGNFEIIQRHGIIALSTTGLMGPYKVQQPTNTYPPSEQPPSSLASIYPNRQKHSDPMAPSTLESTYVLAEDPLIWFSGGQYHVLYDYPDDRVGYHLTSPDGIHDWTDQGLAYDPRMAKQLFSTTDGTVDNWFKMERPGVIMDNGHITHMTFAVSDVDKNNQIPAGSNHGSKVVVLAFDGVAFDAETGIGAGGNGASGAAGNAGQAGASNAGGVGGSAASGAGGAPGTGGTSSSGGTTAKEGAPSNTGGTSSSAGASTAGSGLGGSATAGQSAGANTGSSSGCSCASAPGGAGSAPELLLLAAGLIGFRRRRRR